MSRLAFLAALLALAGCSTHPRVVPVIGPDGSRMLHVSCGGHEGECYRLAGEHCPYGYYVGRTIAGAGNMLVRCRMPMMTPVYPAPEYPVAGPAQPTYAPVAVAAPAPAVTPQAAPSGSAAVVGRLPPVAPAQPHFVPEWTTPKGQVDLGY